MKRIIEYFIKENQNKKLIKNMERYAKEEKIKQQKSKVLGQKPVKGTTNKEKRINVHDSSRV